MFASAIPLALVTGWSVPTAIVVMGVVTMIYTWFGGFKAVVWTDVLQLSVYLAGGVGALLIAWHLAGGADQALARAAAAGKLRVIELEPSLTTTYTLLSGIVGGALLSAASHGTDHLIVQRLLATRSLKRRSRGAGRLGGDGDPPVHPVPARRIGHLGRRAWRPADMPSDQLFPAFVVDHLPAGLAGLVIAGILAAAMGTHSSAINSLASSATHDLYASWTGRRDPAHLLKVGRLISAVWALGLIGGALFFHASAGGGQTPVVVLALSIASVTYGAAARHLFPGGPLAAGARAGRGRRGRRSPWRSCSSSCSRSASPTAEALAWLGARRPAGVALVRPAGHPARGRQRHGAELCSGACVLFHHPESSER